MPPEETVDRRDHGADQRRRRLEQRLEKKGYTKADDQQQIPTGYGNRFR